MLQIKRNSREFKDLKELLSEVSEKPTRKKYLLLYSLKDGSNIDERVLINQADKSGVVFELTLQSVLAYMRDRRKKLFRKERSALYAFKDSAASEWMEFPFELKGPYKKEIFPLRVIKTS
jgi:hypothetical protein